MNFNETEQALRIFFPRLSNIILNFRMKRAVNKKYKKGRRLPIHSMSARVGCAVN
jgi:hypothetical protein